MYYNKETFIEDLSNALTACGISQKELAIKADMTEAAISNYMNGKRVPNRATYQKLNDALNGTLEKREAYLKEKSKEKREAYLKEKSKSDIIGRLMLKKDFETIEKIMAIEKQIKALQDEENALLESL